ncbi:MAG TPA: glycosyltransferase family 4 protein [Candidatus Paceibacterota bacterium]
MPRIIKYPLILVYIFWRCLTRGKQAGSIVLSFAGVLKPGEIVHGGKVKLLALREGFSESWKHFNIAYLVSSGLPFAPSLWISIYKFFGIKIVWNQNGVAYPAWAREKTDRINSLMKPIHKADYVVYQTEFTKRSSDKFLGKYAGPSCVLVNPVDTRKFKPREMPLSQEPFTIIMSGHHFESEERLKVSIEAVRLLANIKLIVVGNTRELPQEDWIEVIGKFTQEEAPNLYHKAHIMLHLKNLDPCPTFVLEALASGLPVVGLSNGGMPELVDERSGVLIPCAEDFEKFHYPKPEEVVEAILKAKSNLASFSLGARIQALKFDKEIWLKRHEEIFNDILK